MKRTRPQRRGEDLEPAYVRFLHEHGICPVCLRLAEGTGEATPRPGCEGAHTANGGTSLKGPDSSRAPLCRAHHRLFDSGRKWTKAADEAAEFATASIRLGREDKG